MANFVWVGDEDGNRLGDPIPIDDYNLADPDQMWSLAMELMDRINRFSTAKKIKRKPAKRLNIMPRKAPPT